MSTFQGTRAASDGGASPFEELSGGYYRNGDRTWTPNSPRHRDEPLIGRNPGSPGPGSRKPKAPPAPPRLGPTERAILGHLVACDGLTAAEIGERLGRTARSVQRSVNGLSEKSCIAVLTYRAGVGTAARIWGATTTGRAALEAHQQGAQA